jgi:nicotinic acid mononucleotide adenylyltransferase
LDLVNSSVRERVVDLRGSAQVPEVVEETARERIFITDVVMVDNSATEIRRALSADNWSQLTMLIPPPVADYVKKYQLYRESNEA